MAKGVGFADRYGGDRGVNRIEEGRGAGSLSTVMRDFQEVRGKFVSVREHIALNVAFDIAGQQK